jgi:hypothetical protein
VDCHASDKNGSVLGSNENFCQGCHAYAAVKIDCFECHSSKRHTATAVAGAAASTGKEPAPRTEVSK